MKTQARRSFNLVIGFLEKNPVDPHLFVAYLDKHRTANLEA